MLGKLKDLYNLQKQAKAIKAELSRTHVEAENNGITVRVTCDQEVVSILISEEAYGKGKEHIERNAKDALNKAQKKAQEIAAEKMKSVMGGMGLPGLGA